jgi:MYXO-CTERM domain-containing protein
MSSLRRRANLVRAALFASVAAVGAASATTVGPVTEVGGSPGTASQRAPTLSYDPGRNVYLVVWEDGRSAVQLGSELYLARLSAAGALLDASGVPVLVPPQPGDQTQPHMTRSPAGHHVIAWTDPRGGSADVYATRYFADGSLFPEPAGTQLTATPIDAEGRPQVACANQACLVVFQQTSGATNRVRGVRISQSGDVRDATPLSLVAGSVGATGELAPTVTASTALFYVAWEDDRNRANGLLGADLFVRTVPDLGATLPAAGSVLASADYRQAFASLAPLGAREFVAVWQDQRAGTSTTVGEDVWRQRISLSGNTTGAAIGLVTAARPQLTPRVATSAAGGGLVVWQDFRSGTFGATYGTRIDAVGNTLDGSGFPLIEDVSNVIEQAVVKGPGDDYLVVAVRSTPAPSRLVFRLVRLEPPAGSMMAIGTLQVPADGASRATARFGLARGASGLPVVDGTRYTVTVSRPDVTVLTPDIDPATPGHQVVAVGGEIQVQAASLRPGPATVDVASTEGASTGRATLTFDNVAPTVDAVVLSPSMPRSDQDLSLSYRYADVNGDAESGSQIQWLRNGMVVGAYTNQRTVPASATFRRDVWRASVRASDGLTLARDPVFSNEVVILNTPPSADLVRIEPSRDVKTDTTLTVQYRYVDPDNDPETQTAIAWTLDGAPRADLDGARTVPAAEVRKNQVWRVAVAPSDGADRGPVVRSATVTIQNSAPVARAGDNVDVTERRPVVLDGRGSSDADPADRPALVYTWRQTTGPTVALSSTRTASVTFTAPSIAGTTQLEFALEVADDMSRSVEDRVVVLVAPVPDPDRDGLDDEEEALAGTDPARGDTDRDGLPDGEEVNGVGTNPRDEDSDDDGVRDGAEIMPGDDADGDGQRNALDSDADGDGLFDGTEAGVGAPPQGTDLAAARFVADADRDTTTNPVVADTDGDGLADGAEDANRNGRVELGESDPNDATSTVGCQPDRSCPAGLVCAADACRSPAAPDAGLACTPIAARGTECCVGGCANGTAIAAICVTPGRGEVCPANATECSAGACSAEPTPAPPDSGCGCSTEGGAGSSAAQALGSMGAVFALRRRRSRAGCARGWINAGAEAAGRPPGCRP